MLWVTLATRIHPIGLPFSGVSFLNVSSCIQRMSSSTISDRLSGTPTEKSRACPSAGGPSFNNRGKQKKRSLAIRMTTSAGSRLARHRTAA
eukprot:8416066-Pyramimonas_sp.AAC.1